MKTNSNEVSKLSNIGIIDRLDEVRMLIDFGSLEIQRMLDDISITGEGRYLTDRSYAAFCLVSTRAMDLLDELKQSLRNEVKHNLDKGEE